MAHHAQAQRVWVSLEADRDGRRPVVRLGVADDGVGFPWSHRGGNPDGHLGLRLVSDRVSALGGRLDVDDRPGGGAVVTVELPVDHEL